MKCLFLCSCPSSLPLSYNSCHNSSLWLLKFPQPSPTLHLAQEASKRVCNQFRFNFDWLSLYSNISTYMCILLLDMVELMLMQNAQMHQIIMHNMMLKAMPPMFMSPLGGPSRCTPPITYQVHTNTYTVLELRFCYFVLLKKLCNLLKQCP